MVEAWAYVASFEKTHFVRTTTGDLVTRNFNFRAGLQTLLLFFSLVFIVSTSRGYAQTDGAVSANRGENRSADGANESRAAPEELAGGSQPLAVQNVDALSAKAATIQALLSERQYWMSRYTNLHVPATLTVLGIVTMLPGAILAGLALQDKIECARDEDCNGDNADGEHKIGMGLAIGGALTLLLGVTLLSFRTSESRQTLEVGRIDAKLRELGVQAKLSPWLSPRARAQGGAGGLSVSASF